jgi:hypothetical protein
MTRRPRVHHHLCAVCRTPVVCHGEQRHNPDGYPETLCSVRHQDGGLVVESYCATCAGDEAEADDDDDAAAGWARHLATVAAEAAEADRLFGAPVPGEAVDTSAVPPRAPAGDGLRERWGRLSSGRPVRLGPDGTLAPYQTGEGY